MICYELKRAAWTAPYNYLMTTECGNYVSRYILPNLTWIQHSYIQTYTQTQSTAAATTITTTTITKQAKNTLLCFITRRSRRHRRQTTPPSSSSFLLVLLLLSPQMPHTFVCAPTSIKCCYFLAHYYYCYWNDKTSLLSCW